MLKGFPELDASSPAPPRVSRGEPQVAWASATDCESKGPVMSARPHPKAYLKLRRNRRCAKCGKLLNPALKRCKGCAMQQPKVAMGKKPRKAQPFRRRKKG